MAVDTTMLLETVVLFVVMSFNLVILAGVRIAVLQISFGLISAAIAVGLINVMLFPYLNILLILVCVFQLLNAITGVKKGGGD